MNYKDLIFLQNGKALDIEHQYHCLLLAIPYCLMPIHYCLLPNH